MIRSLGFIAMAGLLQSGEAITPRAIVDKAIKAHGGEANLTKHQAMTMKGTGTFYGLGEGIPYTGNWAFQGLTQQSVIIESKVNDMTFKFHNVVNGTKGWMKINDDAATAMSKEELDEEHEKMFARWVGTLVPLKDKSFDLALIGEAKVGKKPAIGVRVSKKGHRDISLYFDKTSGLLVKTESPARDVKADADYTQTTFFEEFREIMGVQRATKIVVQKDGKRLVEAQMTELQPQEKLDNSVFKEP
jgi:hypothetical protein